jgi:hypothetical protein
VYRTPEERYGHKPIEYYFQMLTIPKYLFPISRSSLCVVVFIGDALPRNPSPS